jgi:Zn-dependent M28 family amino/carboxypeptidase
MIKHLLLAPAFMVAAGCATIQSPAPTNASAISPDRLSEDVKVLASEPFGGRAPGTPGETRTVDWLIEELKEAGLQPGGADGQWTQAVPLVRTQLGEGSMMATVGGLAMPLAQANDIYVSTVRSGDRVRIAGAQMVFVGYGITAPERRWDDFKDVDLVGKVAVFLVNDPDFEAAAEEPVAGKFGDRRMTYYGRWTYKFEEAARRGAVGALIVHDTPGAGYGWDTVTAPAGENYDIAGASSRLALQGWLHGDAAVRLFGASGLDLAKQRVAARSSDFKPVALSATFSADMPVTHEALMSQNVLARLPGTVRPDEVVMYGAHWDAYGKGAPDAQGRTIRPGANDDALGVAGLLEIARVLKRGPALERSVVFGFWTAEERGLLGSETYAVDPIYPAAKTVANITLDILQTGGPARDVMLVGKGQNSLENDLFLAAATQGRTVTPETLPERGLFYRADHFSLAKRGVPTLLFMAISGAPDLATGGRAAGQEWLDGYMRCYHQTCDTWSEQIDFKAAAEDVALALTVGRELATSDRWPEWQEGSEFRRVRLKSLGR